MEYRVYQNLTQFAITVEANSEKEAIEIAQKMDSEKWEEYEPVAENIFYDAILFN